MNFFKQKSFRVTVSGRLYVESPAYLLQMIAMVGQSWVPEKEFYDLLLLTTAMALSETSSLSKEDAPHFKRFIADNLAEIRAAIDRVKIDQPAISMSEENWLRALQPATEQS
ncbi:MAG TPA: hypothetical protein VNO32_06920 [Candidatus Acidoferrum sp.]|jgi:hypothetical protein|nr:hypothetical protein [Candidatus Acidoferrum sp.]